MYDPTKKHNGLVSVTAAVTTEPLECLSHTLITGPSGSGKTYLSQAFKNKGIPAWDADEVKGLCGWYDYTGGKVAFPPDADKAFLDSHRFLWNRQALIDFLKVSKRLFLFGISRNALEMTDLFHKVYFLKVPETIQIERLMSEKRINPMGRTPYQIEYSIKWARINEEKAIGLNIPFIDATFSSEDIIKSIVDGY